MKSVLATSAFVAALTMIGRLLGFGRELLLGASLGPTETADAAIVLLTLPDLFVTLLLAGGFSAALIPALKRAAVPARVALTRRVGFATFVFFALLAGLLSAVPSGLVNMLAPALDITQVPRFGLAFLLSAITLPLVALAGVAGAYLNAKGVFGVPTLGVISYNLVLCLYLGLIASASMGLLGLAVAIVMAVLIRLSMHLIAARELIAPGPTEAVRAETDRTIMARFAIGVASSGLVFAAPLIFRAIYAAEGDGLLTLFNFAQKMFELPSGILIAPLVLVMLPKLSALAIADSDAGRAEFDRAFVSAIVAAVSIATSAALVTVIFAEPLAALLFRHGVMTQANTDGIAELVVVFIIGLPFLAAQQIASAALNAQGRPGTVALSAAIALIMALALCGLLALVAPQQTLPTVLTGPVIGVVLFQIVMAVLNLRALPTARAQLGPMSLSVGRSLLRACVAIAPFGLLMAYFDGQIGRWTGTGLAGVAFGTLLLTNFSDLRPMLRMRSGQV